MKKLLLMFVMLLGSVATMQAQSFDFSCGLTAAEQADQDLTPDFDLFQTPLFTSAQSDAILAMDRFRQSRNSIDNGRRFLVDVNQFARTAAYPSGMLAQVIIDAMEDEDGNTVYEVHQNDAPNSEAHARFTDFDEAIAFATSLIDNILNPPVDPLTLDEDDNGFTVAEETMLSEATFNVPDSANPGIYLREYANTDHGDGSFSYTPVWIHAVDGGFQARGDDGFPDTTRDTLAELIAFLDAFDFYSL